METDIKPTKLNLFKIINKIPEDRANALLCGYARRHKLLLAWIKLNFNDTWLRYVIYDYQDEFTIIDAENDKKFFDIAYANNTVLAYSGIYGFNLIKLINKG